MLALSLAQDPCKYALINIGDARRSTQYIHNPDIENALCDYNTDGSKS